MPNDYFTKSGYPGTSARAVSASLRAEIANIEAGFDKLPDMTGNGSKLVRVNSGATALEVADFVLAIASGKTLTFPNTLTIQGTDDETLDVVNGGKFDWLDSATVAATSTTNCTFASVTRNFARVGNIVVMFGFSLGSSAGGAGGFTIAQPITATGVLGSGFGTGWIAGPSDTVPLRSSDGTSFSFATSPGSGTATIGYLAAYVAA